jgi:hypothetical protein
MGDIVSPGGISKGVIHRVVDDFVNTKDGAGHFVNRAAFLEGLTKATTSAKYIALLETIPNANRNDIAYLQRKFYSTPNGWRADGEAVYGIMRVGLIEALRQAGTTLLLDSFWLAVAGNTSTETIVIKKDPRVTRIFVTPTMALPSPAKAGAKKKAGGAGGATAERPRQRTEPAEVWVVAARGSSKEKKGHKVTDARVVAVDGKVVVWQRLEFKQRPLGGVP